MSMQLGGRRAQAHCSGPIPKFKLSECGEISRRVVQPAPQSKLLIVRKVATPLNSG